MKRRINYKGNRAGSHFQCDYESKARMSGLSRLPFATLDFVVLPLHEKHCRSILVLPMIVIPVSLTSPHLSLRLPPVTLSPLDATVRGSLILSDALSVIQLPVIAVPAI